MSTDTTAERTQGAGGPLVGTGGHPVPGALELGLLAVAAIVIVDASLVVATDTDPLGASLRAAHAFLGPASWRVGFILLAMAIGLLRRAAAAAAVTDSALDDGLGLVRAVGDATVLARENARLEAERRASTYELRRSRVRIATAAAAERRRLEREFHDRAQNRLVALQIRLGLARERAEESLRVRAAGRADPRRRQKLGVITGAGHRVTGKRTSQNASRRARRGGGPAGWEFVHVCVDDATRLAYVEVLSNEQGATAAGFLRRAVAFYDSDGITVQRVMSDNGACYCSTIHALACRLLGLRHLRTRPFGHAPTERQSDSSAPC